MNPLIQKLKTGQSGILLYGLTPPKLETSEEKVREITQRRLSRLSEVTVDGLILYDIQDESGRANEERPFPYLQTLDPITYRKRYLAALDLPCVLYQCVGKYSPEQLVDRSRSIQDECTVLVGASTRSEVNKTRLSEAYSLVSPLKKPFLGGVTIPERHVKHGNEHERLLEKQKKGVGFFVSQFIFDIGKLKNLLSDYYYLCRERDVSIAPVIFTVTPCGSGRTLDLLRWLGVSVPRWMENDLIHARDTLGSSMDMCLNSVAEISRYCLDKGIPFGCNVESVSVRKEEVLASFELVRQVEARFREWGLR